MLIVLDCPNCKKRYEVDAALAGKKSRCKQCGEVFKIPVPRAVPASPTAASTPRRPAPTSFEAAEWPSVRAEPRTTAKSSFDTAPIRSHAGSPASAPTKIVLNCPNCAKRYEVDGALAGKKSRCKDCGEVFSIPVPRGRVSESSTRERPTSHTPAALAAPPTPACWESVLDEEPSTFKASRGPVSGADDDLVLPPPPRAAYPKPSRKSSYRPSSGNNPDVGITIAGFYVLLVVVVGLGFWIWKTAAEPTNERIGAIFGLTTFFVHVTAMVLGFSGSIWILVLAFREKLEQGLLCLLVPCYELYYVCSRWEDTRGAFILQMLPAANMVVVAAVAFSIGYVQGYERTASATSAGPASAAAPAHRGPTANRFKVEEAEAAFRDYIMSIDNVTNQLVNAQRPGSNAGTLHSLMRSIDMVKIMENRTRFVNLGRNEWTVVKHRVGEKLRSSLGALKSEMTRIEAQRGMRGVFGNGPRLIDKEIAFWTIQPGEEVEPELDDGPAMPLGPMPVPGGPPPGFGMPPGRGGRGFGVPGNRNPADPNYQFQKFNAEHGERSVTIMFSGIPANSDPVRGVTARDVSEAVRKRLQVLAPGATNFMWMGRDNKSALVLSPVDDIPGLSSRIDFGTATVKGNQIDVQISADYIASVPRLPAEQPAPAGDPGRVGHNTEPEFPPNADAVTKSLVQMKSPHIHKKKEGLDRLERTPPDERLAEVVTAILPLLEDDDGWLVGDAIKVLAIWKSPDAVPALIRRTGDNRGSVRHEAIKALGKIKDPRGVEPIVVRIQEDGGPVEDSLKEMGPMAEQALIERLTNPNSGVRRRVCEILKFIGGKETLKAMQSIPPDPDFGVRIAAKDAMSNIVLRVGPLSPSERKGKAAAGSTTGRVPKS